MSEALAVEPRGLATRAPAGTEWTYTDLAALPGDTRGYEVVEGSLVVSPKPSPPHQYAALTLATELRAAAPAELVVLPELDVDLGRNVFEPDIVVIQADGYKPKGPLHAVDLVLAVEVTSPSSRSVDRIIKPSALAAAGVPHYWRADLEGEPYIEVFVLDAGAYRLAATARAGTPLQLDQPFPITLDPAVLRR